MQNNTELIKKLKTATINKNDKLVSLNVSNMFRKIPKQQL